MAMFGFCTAYNNTNGTLKGCVTLAAPGTCLANKAASNLVVLADVSASMGSTWVDSKDDKGTPIDTVRRVLRLMLQTNPTATIIAFSDAAKIVYSGKSDEPAMRDVSNVDALVAAGDTNVEAAFSCLRANILPNKGETHVIFISDGCPTAGERSPDKLRNLLTNVGPSDICTLHFLTIGIHGNYNFFESIFGPLDGSGFAIPNARSIPPSLGLMMGRINGFAAKSINIDLLGEKFSYPLMVGGDKFYLPFELNSSAKTETVTMSLNYRNGNDKQRSKELKMLIEVVDPEKGKWIDEQHYKKRAKDVLENLKSVQAAVRKMANDCGQDSSSESQREVLELIRIVAPDCMGQESTMSSQASNLLAQGSLCTPTFISNPLVRATSDSYKSSIEIQSGLSVLPLPLARN